MKAIAKFILDGLAVVGVLAVQTAVLGIVNGGTVTANFSMTAAMMMVALGVVVLLKRAERS